MKNILLTLLALSTLTSCDNKGDNGGPSANAKEGWKYEMDYYSDGMHYKIFQANGAIYVVNITKDSLDCLVAKNSLSLDTLNTKYKTYFLENLTK